MGFPDSILRIEGEHKVRPYGYLICVGMSRTNHYNGVGVWWQDLCGWR
jgi:hypothetical protein